MTSGPSLPSPTWWLHTNLSVSPSSPFGLENTVKLVPAPAFVRVIQVKKANTDASLTASPSAVTQLNLLFFNLFFTVCVIDRASPLLRRCSCMQLLCFAFLPIDWADAKAPLVFDTSHLILLPRGLDRFAKRRWFINLATDISTIRPISVAILSATMISQSYDESLGSGWHPERFHSLWFCPNCLRQNPNTWWRLNEIFTHVFPRLP